MKKKVYIKPSIEVVDIKGNIDILGGSSPSDNGIFADDEGVGFDDNPSPGFGNNNSIWD